MRRTTGPIAAVLLAVAGAAVMLLALGRSPTFDERLLIAIGTVAIAIAVVAFRPLRALLDQWADRVLARPGHDPGAIVTAVSQLLAEPVETDDLRADICHALRSGLPVECVELWGFDDSSLVLEASDPYRERSAIFVTPAEAQALMGVQLMGTTWLRAWVPALLDEHADEQVRAVVIREPSALLGTIVVELSPGVEELTMGQERALLEVGRQVALKVQNSRLDGALRESVSELGRQADELQRSRLRVVTAGDVQRRRLERDLHDGAQQHLVALSMNLRLAQDLARTDPEGAAEMLHQLGREIDAAMGELRDLAHGIYPPLLQQQGLDQALRVAAQRSGLEYTVSVACGRHPPDVEATVYFCCLEALQNAAKHAGPGTRIIVQVEEEAGAISFRVDDDGAGFSAEAPAGAGLTGMTDRVEALGGRLDVGSTAGDGTHVHGVIPLGRERGGQAS
jgi:signal transduction histidine kinase